MVKKLVHRTAAEIEQLRRQLASPEEVERGNRVRGFCPCHAGWEQFEAHVGDVLSALRDPSHVVRAHALHVFDDAARMRSEEDLRYYVEAGEERIGEKRACHFRSIEERWEARSIGRAERERSRRRRRIMH